MDKNSFPAGLMHIYRTGYPKRGSDAYNNRQENRNYMPRQDSHQQYNYHRGPIS